MDSFLIAINVVTPLFIYMLIGIFIRQRGILSADHFRSLNNMLFQVILPITLFIDIYEADVSSSIRPMIFTGVLAGVIFFYLMTWITISHLVKKQEDKVTIIQAIYRSNYVLFGTSIGLHLCGSDGMALISSLAALVVPLYNILSVILFELNRDGNIKPIEIIKNIFKNPLVDAGLFGIIFSLFHITIPAILLNSLESLGNTASPLALVALGGMLHIKSLLNHKKYLLITMTGRLIIIPFLAILAAVTLGLRGDALVAIMAVFAVPTAVASVPMSQSMGGNGALAGELVASTSAGCIITIFLFTYALLKLGFI
ncbi:MAG: AEC family transporter [Clostridiales bacterium]|nr:AEC family transporter [Clostridiales bacterium]